MTLPSPPVLGPDGTATLATPFLLVHRALRRDLGLLPVLVRALPPADRDQAAALMTRWRTFRAALTHHHHFEDERLFPALLSAEPQLLPVLRALDEQHAALDGALDVAEAAVLKAAGQSAATAAADPTGVPGATSIESAAATLEDLAQALHAHLLLEEAHLVPVMLLAPQAPHPDRGNPEPSEAAVHAPPPADTRGQAPVLDMTAWVVEGLDAKTARIVLTRLPGGSRQDG